VNADNASAVTTVTTDQDGNFSIPYGYECPSPDTQMYLVSAGGDAGGGTNPNLSLIAALGSCTKLDASRFVIDEATTAAAIYALSGFMTDVRHVGSGMATSAGIATAFATANDLVDAATGLVRQRTVSGAGIVPQTKINTMANLVGACASTAGSTQADGSPCDLLFQATNPGTTTATQANDTAQALLDLARNATGFANAPGSFATLYRVAASSPRIEPALSAEPSDWTLAIEFPVAANDTGGTSANATGASFDAAGNVWVRGSGTTDVEFVGAALLVRANNLIPLATALGRVP
jgi:hypothetical protein